jgi:hypothetical protein
MQSGGLGRYAKRFGLSASKCHGPQLLVACQLFSIVFLQRQRAWAGSGVMRPCAVGR